MYIPIMPGKSTRQMIAYAQPQNRYSSVIILIKQSHLATILTIKSEIFSL